MVRLNRLVGVAAVALLCGLAPSAFALGGNSGAPYPNPVRLGIRGVLAYGGGMRVVDVFAGYPAADVGLEYGDVILSANGTPINSHASMQRALDLAELQNGGHLTLIVRNVHDGWLYQIDADLAVIHYHYAKPAYGQAGPGPTVHAKQAPKVAVKNVQKKRIR